MFLKQEWIEAGNKPEEFNDNSAQCLFLTMLVTIREKIFYLELKQFLEDLLVENHLLINSYNFKLRYYLKKLTFFK